MSSLERATWAVAKGLAAGLAGTAAMSVSTAIEQRVTGRPSTAPADAAGKLLGVRPAGPQQARRFGVIVHWAYGTSWGAVRGLLACTGLPGPAASAAHLATLWVTEQIMLPALGVVPPITEWSVPEIAVGTWHQFTYAATVGSAYELLDRVN